MKPAIAFSLAFLASFVASPAVADEVADLRAVRSLVAEAALVGHEDRKHHLLGNYAAEMRSLTCSHLVSELANLGPRSPATSLVRAALAALKSSDEHQLEHITAELSRIVSGHERAD
jgi:hypothetical protein